MQVSSSVNPTSTLGSLEPESTGPLVIDMSDATFIEPFGLVVLACIAERAKEMRRAVRLVAPTSQDVANYVARIGLGEVLDLLHVDNNVTTVHANPLPNDLLELRRVDGEHAGEQVAALVYNKLQDSGVDPRLRDTLYTSICEVVGNMATHAHVAGGYVTAQTTHRGRRISFAIADSGRGLRASLSDNLSLLVDDDATAVNLAVTRNISATGEQGRGQGLPEVVESVSGLEGVVHIASGSAYSAFRRLGTKKKSNANPFHGTAIQVELAL